MVYPSHYEPNFFGFAEPEAHPYEVVHFSMQTGISRANELVSTTHALASTTPLIDYKNKLRPWIQDFGLRMDYGQAEVKAQIKAVNDLGLSSWLLWSASNKYTERALQPK